MPEWIVIVILGIIEGITEFLPVSSTGHLLLAERWLPHQTDLFNIVIQTGAVLAVLPLFPERLRQFAFQWREKATQDYALKILCAFCITGVGGLILDKKGFKLPEALAPVAWALLIGGIGFVAVEFWLKKKQLGIGILLIALGFGPLLFLLLLLLLLQRWRCGKNQSGENVTWEIAIAVGLAQLVAAVFPGASRSGTTILFCLILGLARPAATEFSFLVGIPTMVAAGGLKIFKALHHHAPGAPQENWSMVLLGTVVAAVVSFVAVKWLLGYVRTHTFTAFGWYRIALALVVFALLWK